MQLKCYAKIGRWLGHGLLACILLCTPAYGRSIIRDAEVEHTLGELCRPIFRAADLDPERVRIFIIGDPSINAFVAGGMNMFFHTGLLTQAPNVEMLSGVIAHEAGHIAGAHLVQLASANDNAALGALITTIIGAAAAIGGGGEAGAAVILAGQNTSLKQLLSHYRGNEQQADQAALRYLEQVGISAKAMIDMFELLRLKERQHSASGGDPYLRTHPLTRDRISAMRTALAQEATPLPPIKPALLRRHQRMVAKLQAFLEPVDVTLRRYPESRKDEAAHLARAVAWYRYPDLDKAIKEANALIALSADAFAYDLKGQILFEHGKVQEAIQAYGQALAKPHGKSGLILTDLGRAYLALEDTLGMLEKAMETLEDAIALDSTNHQTYRLLSLAYGKLGQLGRSYLALAQSAALQSNADEMRDFALRAKPHLTAHQGLLLQADDLIADAARLKKSAQ